MNGTVTTRARALATRWAPRLASGFGTFLTLGFWFTAISIWLVGLELWFGWDGPTELVLQFGLTGGSSALHLVQDLPGGAALQVDATAPATLTVPGLPASLHLLSLLPTTLATLCAGAGCLVLLPVVQSILQGRPFERTNPGRLARLAGLLLVGGLADTALRDRVSQAVLDHLAAAGHPLPLLLIPRATDPYVAGALGLLLLAWTFRRGLQASRDTEGLV